MKWDVIKSCSCKATKTTFSLMKTDRNIRLILWYDSKAHMQRGDVLRSGIRFMYINNEKVEMHILKVMPYSKTLWKTLLKSTSSSGDKTVNSKVA